ncbi:signal peptidase I [Jatrophihabitans endophyticus]|uniref:Signal peptidase I n=1 Tax=Jatrophihabitans endophyticus TaxID=1206085 RepID=A0A1M5CCL6_9ACTN|nr:signal peptidase I [Jatrophihabitans endophyticus]SHF52493.1 signal peptidase I [Jatrophihabitans endophyticus]
MTDEPEGGRDDAAGSADPASRPDDGTRSGAHAAGAAGETAAPAEGADTVESAASTHDAAADDALTPDASTPDASTPDASTPDASTPDASTPDASTPDASHDAAAEDGAVVGDAAADEHGGESRWRRRRREKAAKPRRKAPWWELPLLVAVAIGIAILVKSFVVQPFYIPSDSMEKTLHGCPGCSGDRILVNKPIYSVIRDPEPGDIVVFDAPDGWERETTSSPPGNPVVRVVRGFGQLIGFVPPDGEVLVKRVIAVGGQTVKGVQVPTTAAERSRTGMKVKTAVMVSDKGPGGPFRTLDEPYTYRAEGDGDDRAFPAVTVPKGRLWVMGDHRTDSADSRYHCAAGGEDVTETTECNAVTSTVPVDKVIGKAFVIAWPPSRWGTLGTPSTFESASAAAGPELPAAASLAVVAPVLVVRRRRRRDR